MTNTPTPALPSDVEELRAACDWPEDLTFRFLDEPDEHDPCYVIMPGGAMLSLAHHDKNGVDQARAKFIVLACNEKIAAMSRASAPTDKEAGDRELLAQECDRLGNRHMAAEIRTGGTGMGILCALSAISRARSASVTGKAKLHEDLLHEANSYIGLARFALQNGQPDIAAKHLDKYVEESDRIEVRYLGPERAQKLLDSGVINPSTAYADEIKAQSPTPTAHGEGELREALKPFAARAVYYDETNGDNGPELDTVEVRGGITVGDLRRAEHALSHAPSPPQQDGSGLVEEAQKVIRDIIGAGTPFDARGTHAQRVREMASKADDLLTQALASTPKAGGREKP